MVSEEFISAVPRDAQIQETLKPEDPITRAWGREYIAYAAAPHRAVFGFRSHASPTTQCANYLGWLHNHSASRHIQPPAGSRGPQIREWYRHGTRSKSFHFPSPNPLHCKRGWHVPDEIGAFVSRTPLHSHE